MGSFSRKLKKAPNAGTINGVPSLSARVERFAQPMLDAPWGAADESSLDGVGVMIAFVWNMGARPALPQDESNVRGMVNLFTRVGTMARRTEDTPPVEELMKLAQGEPVVEGAEGEQMQQAQDQITAYLMAMIERRRTLFGADRRKVARCIVKLRGKRDHAIEATEETPASP